MGCHFLLQGIFLTQGSNHSCLCIGRRILYHCATWKANFSDVTSAIYSAFLSLSLLTHKMGRIRASLGALSAKESTCQCRGTRSVPDPGRPHVLWGDDARAPPLSGLCSRAESCTDRAHAPQLLKPGHPETTLRSQKSRRGEAPAWRLESSPHTAARGKPTRSEDPAQPKVKK